MFQCSKVIFFKTCPGGVGGLISTSMKRSEAMILNSICGGSGGSPPDDSRTTLTGVGGKPRLPPYGSDGEMAQ